MPDKKAPAEAVTAPARPAGDGAGKPTRKKVESRAPRLTNAQRREAWTKAGGKCFVFGTAVDPFSSFAVVDGYVLGEEAKKLAGGDGIEELRERLVSKRAKVREAVTSAKALHDLAVANEALLLKTFECIFQSDGRVVFKGEPAMAGAQKSPAPPAGGAQ